MEKTTPMKCNRSRFLYLCKATKRCVFLFACFLLSGNMTFLKAQLRDPITEQYDFSDGTLDILNMDGIKYSMEQSPLNVFKGYIKLYPEIPMVIEETMPGSRYTDKNYAIDWILVDNLLYLSDIHFRSYLLKDSVYIIKYFSNNNEKFARMERLTQRKFEKYKYLKEFTYIPNPYGVLEASWVTDTIYIKKPYRHNESYEGWKATPSYRLVFNKGKLMSMSEVPAYIDTFTGVRYIDDKRKKEWTLRMELKNGKIVDIKRLKYRKSKNINPKSKAS